MMTAESLYARIGLSRIIASIFLALIMGLSWVFFQDISEKMAALLGGVIASFIAVLMQFLLEWNEHREIERLKALQIRKILKNRMDRPHYEELIKNAKKEIFIMGVTANRFLRDFADLADTGNTALISALKNSDELKIRVLVAAKNQLEAGQAPNWDFSNPKLEVLKTTYPGRFLYAYYDHIPTHSIMRIDNEVIVGPIFPDVESRLTPSLQIDAGSPFVEQYLKYFEQQWRHANQTIS